MSFIGHVEPYPSPFSPGASSMQLSSALESIVQMLKKASISSADEDYPPHAFLSDPHVHLAFAQRQLE